MKSMLSFVSEFNDVVRTHIEETKECVGKEVVDKSAKKAGICIDRVKHVFGTKFSMLGRNYEPVITNKLQAFKEDVLVCRGVNGIKFLVPVSDVVANGKGVILVKSTFHQPEVEESERRKQDVLKKYQRTTQAIEKIMPKVAAPKTRKKKSGLRIFH